MTGADELLYDRARAYEASGGYPDAPLTFDHPGLRVLTASPEHLLAMKAMAARRRVTDGLRLLVGGLRLTSAEQVVEVCSRVFPTEPLPDRARLVLAELFERIDEADERELQRPRMRASDGSGELPVPAYELFSSTQVLGRMAMQRMLAALSSRRYPVGLEPVGQRVEQSARSTSKSAISRRFVAATETALGELLAAPLGELDLVALMIDGVHFGEHLCVVALGIGIDGVKHPLGLAEGSTENTSVVTDLLTGLRDRGLDTTRPIFVGIDGGKALRAAVIRVFDHPVIGRCQLHKIRNVADKLPDHLAATVTKRMRAAYHAESALGAEAQLEALARELERTHPGAAGSLREGLAETLTVLRLNVSPTLARTLRSTNSIESMISIARNHSANVKNWQNGNMALRWCAAGMIEARGQFRRVNGYMHLPALHVALDEHVAAQTVGAVRHDESVIAA